MNAHLDHYHVSVAFLALRVFVGLFDTKTDEKQYLKLIYLLASDGVDHSI